MRFIPPLRLHALTPVYDAVLATVMPERRIRASLAEAAPPAKGAAILDLGCGTGSQALELAARYPDCDLHAVDPAATALSRAAAKARRHGARRRPAAIQFVRARAESLPYPDDSFDQVATCLALHHLGPASKRAGLRECRRVLRPGGVLAIADWGPPASVYARLAFYSVRLIDGFSTTADHTDSRLVGRIRAAGFDHVAEAADPVPTAFGTVRIWAAT